MQIRSSNIPHSLLNPPAYNQENVWEKHIATHIYITGMIISYIFLFKISQVVLANITNAVAAVNIISYHHCRSQIIGGSYLEEADLRPQDDCQYGDKNSPPAHFQLSTLGGCGDNLNSRVPET